VVAVGRYREVLVGCVVAGLLTSCAGSGQAPGAPAGQSTAVVGAGTTAGPALGALGSLDQANSTASPPATPAALPSAAGTERPFAGEGLSDMQATELQAAVDGGHQPWRLDQARVATAFVEGRFGWTEVDSTSLGPLTILVTDRASRQRVALQVRQPARQGSGGIWVVASGVAVN
jgi:hypothetical protein